MRVLLFLALVGALGWAACVERRSVDLGRQDGSPGAGGAGRDGAAPGTGGMFMLGAGGGPLAGTGGSVVSGAGGTGGGTGGMAMGRGGTGGRPDGTGGGAAGRPGGTGGISAAGGQFGAGGVRTGVGGAPPGTGGAASGTGGAPTSGCVGNAWPTADPSSPGPFAVLTETNVGPTAGNPDPLHNNMVPQFNLYRPSDLAQGGYCHPIITWGNGHGAQPATYEVLLKQLASHGFVVIASLSSTVSMGSPPPMIVGVSWLIQQNDDPTSQLYHRLDTTHVGATGHSEGAAATTNAGADPLIMTIAAIEGGATTTTVHGPALLLCGGLDTTVPCSRVTSTFDNINNVPVMLGDSLADTQGSWIGSIKGPFMVAVTGWMRFHLLGDIALRNMFYGPSCNLCTDAQTWQVMRKMMD